MKTVGSRIETAIERAGAAVQPGGEFILTGNLEYQSAGTEIFK